MRRLLLVAEFAIGSFAALATVVTAGLFGEEAPGMNSHTTVISALTLGFTTMVALMVWIVKRLLDTTLPQQQATFGAAIDKLLASQHQERQLFTSSLGTVQMSFDKALEKQNETLTKSQERQVSAFDNALDKQRQAFGDSLERQLNAFVKAQDNFQMIVEKGSLSHRTDMEAERAFHRDNIKQQLETFQLEERLDREEFLKAQREICDRVGKGKT